MQGRRGQVCDSQHWTRGQGAPQSAHGSQSANGRSDQDQGEDGCAVASGQGFQRLRTGILESAETFSARHPGPYHGPKKNPGSGVTAAGVFLFPVESPMVTTEEQKESGDLPDTFDCVTIG